MSKNVVIFLVLFVLVAGGALFALKNSATPVTVTTATVTETPAKPAETATAEKTTPDSAAKPADAPVTADTAAPKDDPNTIKDESITGNDQSVMGSGAPAKADDAAKTDDTAKTAEKTEEKTEEKKVEGSPVAQPAVTGGASGSSLLSNSAATDVDMTNALAERELGDPDAPITIIEYASMTCPHCARFSNDQFAGVKAAFIDTGKVHYIYRDYPLDTTALKAAMMARCADRAKYFDLVEVIFKNQERWIKSSDPIAGLKQLGALAGMDESYITSCMNNAELQTELLRRMQDGTAKYKVNATPTFVFNNGAEFLSGDQTVADFQKVIDKLSASKGK